MDKHREGQITASQFGSVRQTRIERPSTSLVKSILERQPSPKAAALEWGSKNEAKARKEYIQSVKGNHVGFKVQTTGLHVNPDFTHLGASPDGLVSCSCCGDGLLEVKCPYSKRHHSPADIHDTAFYLKHTTDGLKLSTKHKYYHQVQGQMAVCKCSYCDFVCWTPLGIHIQRIPWDPSHWSQVKPTLDQFFLSVILPKLLCGHDKQNTDPDSDQHSREGGNYCYCRNGEHGERIACNNPSCKVEWFHFGCVRLTQAPQGDWFCPDCSK